MNWTNRKSVTYSKDSSLLGSNSWCSVVPFDRIHQGVSEHLIRSHIFRNEKKFSYWRPTYPLRRLLCGLELTRFIFFITETRTFFRLPCMCFGRSSSKPSKRDLCEDDVKRAKRGRALLLFGLPRRGAPQSFIFETSTTNRLKFWSWDVAYQLETIFVSELVDSQQVDHSYSQFATRSTRS